MKASENHLLQRLEDFLLTYRSTTHVATQETPSDFFLKRNLRTRFDLLHLDVNKIVEQEQAKLKQNHDHHCQGREYVTGQSIGAQISVQNQSGVQV